MDGSKYTSSPKLARLAYTSISSVGTAYCPEIRLRDKSDVELNL